MYDLAISVAYCLQAGTRVDIAWLVGVRGLDYRGRGDALVVTPGGGRIGSVLAGALDAQVGDLAAEGRGGRLVDVTVSEFEAVLAGLPGTGVASCLVMPAGELPEALWPLLLRREPVALVSELDGNRVTATQLFTRDTIAEAPADVARLFGRGQTDAVMSERQVVTVLWAVPRLIIVGGGPIAEALEAQARLLGWAPQRLVDASAVRVIAGLTAMDALVITTHDRDIDGPALAEALGGDVGYIGALGGPPMQRERREWLTDRGIEGLERIYGPAGLSIGARTPAENALAILAEALATITRLGSPTTR